MNLEEVSKRGEQFVKALGIELDEDQIRLYADPKFDSAQMFKIRTGLKNGLTAEQIKLYADPNLLYNEDQMEQIRFGIEEGLTNEQIAIFSDPKYDNRQMEQIRKGLDFGLTAEQISLYADPRYDGEQMDEIRYGLECGLTEEQIRLYADPKFDSAQMFKIRTGLKNGLTAEQIKLYADPKYNEDQMDKIRYGLENGFTMEQVKICADPKFNIYQMSAIYKSFENGLTKEQVSIFANPEIEAYTMDIIVNSFINKETDKIAIITMPGLTNDMMNVIGEGFGGGLTIDQVRIFADLKYNVYQMAQISRGFEDGLTMEQVSLFADPKYSSEKMRLAREGIERYLTPEQISLYINPDISDEASRIILDFLTDPDIRQNLGLMGMTARVDKDHNITIQYKGKEYSCPANDIPDLVSGSKGIEQIEFFGAMIKYEAAKGRDFDPVRDREDAQNVNAIFHELGEDAFNVNNDKNIAKIAKKVLLGEHYFRVLLGDRYFSDPTYSKDYFNRLTDAFKKHCHGFVPKIIETVAMIGEHTGQDPDEIAKHFNVRALKQLLNRTNDWAQAFLGSQMSVEDRNKFISHPDRNTVTGMYYDSNEKKKTASQWYLNHPTASRDLIKDIMRNIESINLTPDMRTEDVEKQITLSGAERDIKDIENKYGIDLDDMGYNVRHSYTVNHNNGQVARTLLKGEETEMVSLGEFTCCCQEFGEAGETAMMYGLIHPEAGFWVIEDDKGKVLAQAEIWEPYKDHDTIVFDNIEFADDRNISTVIDTLVQWCENSKYKNVIMGTGYNEIDYDKFPEAPINHPALSRKEVDILEEDMESENKETGVWKDGAYFVQYDSDPYLYSDALDECVYLKHDGQIPQEVLDQCSDRYGKDAPVSDKQERYEQVDGELHDKYELAALLSDARYELKDKVPNGYRTLLNVGDDGKCTVCLYKGDDADNKVPFADVARREDGGLDITMRGEEQGLDGMENDIGDTVEDWDDNR